MASDHKGCPILGEDPDDKRLVVYPIQDEELWNMYKAAQQQFWVPEEIDFSKDPSDYAKLKPAEQRILDYALSFFAVGDGIALENLAVNFMDEVKCKEARLFYAQQENMEGIHGETYSLMIHTVVKDEVKKAKLFDAIHTLKSVNLLIQWAKKWMNREIPFHTRLVAYVMYEGFVFSSKFAFIFYFKNGTDKNRLPGITKSNLFIARDEAAHEDFGVLIHKRLKHKCPPEVMHDMMKDLFDIDCEFVREALPEPILGMNQEFMIDYMKSVANKILRKLGAPHLFKVPPSNKVSEYMSSTLGAEVKTNFFEHRNHVYGRTLVRTDSDKADYTADTEDIDF